MNPQEFCQFAISGVIMEDRNAVYAIESAHGRQFIAAGVLSPATVLLSGSAFPCSVCIGDVYIDDLELIYLTHFSLKRQLNSCMPRMSFIEEWECPCRKPNAENSRHMTFGEVSSTVYLAQLDSHWRRRVSLMLSTVVGAVTGLLGLRLKQLLGIWTFALSFRRERLSVLDVAFVAAAAFPPRRRCTIRGASLDELLVTTFLGRLLTANLRAHPYFTLFATDASFTGVSLEQWTKLYDLSEDRGESVRLDLGACPPVDT